MSHSPGKSFIQAIFCFLEEEPDILNVPVSSTDSRLKYPNLGCSYQKVHLAFLNIHHQGSKFTPERGDTDEEERCFSSDDLYPQMLISEAGEWSGLTQAELLLPSERLLSS